MNNQLSNFNFNSSNVRIITRDGEPWFVAADVCSILEIANSRDAVSSLEDDEKGVANADTLGGSQKMQIISESGLFALIFKSRKPEAVKFRKWVTSEVIPQIRKTGGYNLPKNFPEALRLLADQAEENDRLRLTVQEQAPAVEFVQKYVKAEGLFGIRQTAKILGVTQNAFVAMCIEKGVLFRENGTLQPYAEWLGKGYFEVKTGEANEHAFCQTRFTSSGIEWVRGKLEVGKLLAMSA